jgi:hypothetical protein
MALPREYIYSLQQAGATPEHIEYLNANYGPELGNMDQLEEELRHIGIGSAPASSANKFDLEIPEEDMDKAMYTEPPKRTNFRLSSNPKAQSRFTEEQVDDAVRNGFDPSMFTNYGNPGNDDVRADRVMSLLGKNSRNDRALAANPKLDLNKLEPMTAGESIEGLRQAGTNAYRDVKETGGYYLQQADEATKPVRQAISSTAAPVVNKVKQYGEPIYREYVEQPVKREYQRQKDTYNTLAADPEATMEGAKMMARDYGNKAVDVASNVGRAVGDTASTIRNESPSWVARFSKTLSEGSNFGKELKDAWNDPDYYLAGGRYEDKGYRNGIKRPDAAYNSRMQNLQEASGYSKPNAAKLPTAATVSIPAPAKPVQEPQVTQPQQPVTQTTKQSGFSLYNNNSVQSPKLESISKWTRI